MRYSQHYSILFKSYMFLELLVNLLVDRYCVCGSGAMQCSLTRKWSSDCCGLWLRPWHFNSLETKKTVALPVFDYSCGAYISSSSSSSSSSSWRQETCTVPGNMQVSSAVQPVSPSFSCQQSCFQMHIPTGQLRTWLHLYKVFPA